MKLEGLKVNFLGDSITQGASATTPEKAYHQVMKRKYGLEKANNYGVGGTRIARQTVPSEMTIFDYTFEMRAEVMDRDVDAVVVFGGTNDFGHGDAPFGTIHDTDEQTFCGALHALCRKLIDRYPEAQLVIMTPLHRDSEDDGPYNERGIRLSANLEGYVDAILKIAAFYAIPVLDLFRVSGIQSPVPVLKERYIPDGLHPNDAGHARIADKLIGFLNML